MVRKKGFLGVLITDPSPMSNSLSSDTIWFRLGCKTLCGVPYPAAPYVGHLPSATVPPSRRLASKSGGSAVTPWCLLDVNFSAHHCFWGYHPLPSSEVVCS